MKPYMAAVEDFCQTGNSVASIWYQNAYAIYYVNIVI